jgi:hypothetical protein
MVEPLMLRYCLCTLLVLLALEPPVESDEDDGLNISWPAATLVNATGIILVLVTVAKWLGCR